MYAGRIVEHGATRTVLETPQHPYTQALLRCLPERVAPKQELEAIPGAVPNLLDPPAGCYFQPRCKEAVEQCRSKTPQLAGTDGQQVACWQRGVAVELAGQGSRQ
jgi:peptide/nickel transport system ATP-binding protein